MKKTALYIPAAAILGILVVIIPLSLTLQMGNQNPAFRPFAQSLGENSKQAGVTSNTSTSDTSSLEILAVSFAVAVAAYAIAHRRTTRPDIGVQIPPC